MKFYGRGSFSWPLLLAVRGGVGSVRYVGGMISLPTTLYKQVIGAVLLFAAYRLFGKPVGDATRPVSIPIALACGAAIGLLSGLTGVGGGIS